MMEILDLESAPLPEYERVKFGMLSVDVACLYASLVPELLTGFYHYSEFKFIHHGSVHGKYEYSSFKNAC
jgi:hypothetical protein